MIVSISVSILGIDYSDQSMIDQAVMRISNANFLHFDICDGKFVKQKTFDYKTIENTNLSGSGLERDVHLMVKDPEALIPKYLKAGANMISFHVEATKKPELAIKLIQKKGALAGIAISPATPVKKIEKYLDVVDYVLVMTVKPGLPGQKFMKSPIKKIKALRKKYPELLIQVDGGINGKNAGELISAGANILVSGSFILNSKDPKLAIDLLRNA